jgi:hypothetical protein
MTLSRTQVGHFVTEMQNLFLDVPSTSLTLVDARKRFGAPANTCKGVLNALVDAGVLMVTPGGAYVRRFPQHGCRPKTPRETARSRTEWL